MKFVSYIIEAIEVIKGVSTATFFFLLGIAVIFWVPVHYMIGNSDLKKCYGHVSAQYSDHWQDSFWAESNRFTRRRGSHSYAAFVYQGWDFSKEPVTYICDWNAALHEFETVTVTGPGGQELLFEVTRPKIQVLEGNQLDRINGMTWSTATPLGYLHVSGKSGPN